MDVESQRTYGAHAVDSREPKPGREKPKVGTTSNSNVQWTYLQCRDGDLDDRSAAVRDERTPGHPIAMVWHRIDTGVPLEALFREDLESPDRARCDREARGAVSEDSSSEQLFKCGLRS